MSSTAVTGTPFERNIAEQPDALLALADRADWRPLRDLVASRTWDRVVLTGMGSSHFAGLPTWRALTRRGIPIWWVDTGQLLDTPELVDAGTLLITTSQSGASGEVSYATEQFRHREHPPMMIGVTNDTRSPLATTCDLVLPLHSGAEATVSTKSYLNTLAAHRQIIAAFTRDDPDQVTARIRDAAACVRATLDGTDLGDLPRAAIAAPDRRLAAVGAGDSAATALLAGLITKEAAKVPIEGYVGGQFRHGPFELAGEALTVFLYGDRTGTPLDDTLTRLAEDLARTGATTIAVGDLNPPGATTVPTGGHTSLARLATGAVVAQLAAVGMARANNVRPGAFTYGSKITTRR